MKDLPTRGVPDTVAEGLAELAREYGMSAEAYRRKLFADAVAERGYRQLAEQIANDPEEQAYRKAMRERRNGLVARRERQERAA